jgi:microcystin degradation protein MlrC
MKFVITRFQHETNSFSPITTTLSSFHGTWGVDAYLNQKGVNSAMGAFIDLAEELQAEVLTPFAGFANPSGV